MTGRTVFVSVFRKDAWFMYRFIAHSRTYPVTLPPQPPTPMLRSISCYTYTVKTLSFLPSPAGMSLLTIVGNNLIIPSLGEFG
jgi:hypothetical protein